MTADKLGCLSAEIICLQPVTRLCVRKTVTAPL